MDQLRALGRAMGIPLATVHYPWFYSVRPAKGQYCSKHQPS